MFRPPSARKAGGERPKAEGEKAGMERWVFSDVPALDRSVPAGREKIEGKDGDCWCWLFGTAWNCRVGESEAG
jgi:hypothetical protein